MLVLDYSGERNVTKAPRIQGETPAGRYRAGRMQHPFGCTTAITISTRLDSRGARNSDRTKILADFFVNEDRGTFAVLRLVERKYTTNGSEGKSLSRA